MKLIAFILSPLIIFIGSQLQPPDDYRTSNYAGVEAVTVAETPPPVAVQSHPRTFHENQASICINNRTREHYVGELVSREEVVYYAQKYWSGQDLEIMAAITVVEGQRDLNCIGDEVEWFQGRRLYGAKTEDGRTWGASYGLFQIRTIQEDNAPGSCRNKATVLASIGEQFRCAKEIWDNQGYGAWSQYSNGNYRKALGK